MFSVLFVCVAFVASYPSHRDATNDDDNNDFEMELRSILDQLEDQRDNEEQMTRAVDDGKISFDHFSVRNKRNIIGFQMMTMMKVTMMIKKIFK